MRIAIELDDETAQRLEAAARKAGKSDTDWARSVLEERLSPRLPEWWFALLGTWEDERTPDEIMADIRAHTDEPPRASFS